MGQFYLGPVDLANSGGRGAKIGQKVDFWGKNRKFSKKKLFKNGSLDQEYTVLNAVGGKMEKKCQGVPLGAKLPGARGLSEFRRPGSEYRTKSGLLG